MSDENTLEERVDQLEKELRQLKISDGLEDDCIKAHHLSDDALKMIAQELDIDSRYRH